MGQEGWQDGKTNAMSCKVTRIVCVPPAARNPPTPKPAEQRGPPKITRGWGAKPSCGRHPHKQPWKHTRHRRDSVPQPRPRPRAGPGRAAAPRRGAGTAWRKTSKCARGDARDEKKGGGAGDGRVEARESKRGRKGGGDGRRERGAQTGRTLEQHTGDASRGPSLRG